MKDEKGGPMKELDFDELHDAVNKLMDQAQKPKAKREPTRSVAKAAARPSVKVAERSADMSKDEKPAVVKPEPSEDAGSTISVTVKKTAAKIAPKKRGMAMDVVQAAKPSAVAPPSARAARTAPTLQPTGPVKIEPPSPRAASPTPSAAVPAPQSSKSADSTDVSDDMLASLNMQTDGDAKPKTIMDDDHKSEFPDPLDVHGFDSPQKEPARHQTSNAPAPAPHQAMTHSAVPVMPSAPAAAEEDPLLKDEDEPAKNQWEMPGEKTAPAVAAVNEPDEKEVRGIEPAPTAEPAATPFVNAKVEKRPLGAYAGAVAAPAPAQEAPQPFVQEEKPDPATVAMSMAPEELNPEIVAVESADIDYSQPQSATHDTPLNNLRQMSIPPQYHPDSKEASKHDRPIFDTKDYHPPIHPVGTAKHHTGSKAGVILTFILIILLVAAGVGAYFVATGSIDLSSYL